MLLSRVEFVSFLPPNKSLFKNITLLLVLKEEFPFNFLLIFLCIFHIYAPVCNFSPFKVILLLHTTGCSNKSESKIDCVVVKVSKHAWMLRDAIFPSSLGPGYISVWCSSLSMLEASLWLLLLFLLLCSCLWKQGRDTSMTSYLKTHTAGLGGHL